MSIGKVKKCYGCESCALVCGRNAITFNENEFGFIYPEINDSLCINCDICEKVCPSLKKISEQKKYNYYAMHSVDENLLLNSTSGGFATELMRYYIRNGDIVYGVSYSEDFSYAKYIRIDKETDIKLLSGTKYVQAKKGKIFENVLRDLENQRRMLFIGLPCEVASLKMYLSYKKQETKNILFCELICSGPTSNRVLREYSELLKGDKQSDIVYMNMRDKENGWKNKKIKVKFKNENIITRGLYQTCFGKAFYNMARDSCYSCEYKLENSIADLTMGDFWGVNEEDEIYNRNGVSLIISQNEKSEEIIKKIKDIRIKKISYNDAIRNNDELSMSRKRHQNDAKFKNEFKNKKLEFSIFKCRTAVSKMKSFLNYILKREGWYD